MVKYLWWRVDSQFWPVASHAPYSSWGSWEELKNPHSSSLICEIRDEFTQNLIFSENPVGKNAWFLLHNPLWIGSSGWWHFWLPQEREHSIAGWRCGYWIGSNSGWILESWSVQEEEELVSCSDSWDRYLVLSLLFPCSTVCVWSCFLLFWGWRSCLQLLILVDFPVIESWTMGSSPLNVSISFWCFSVLVSSAKLRRLWANLFDVISWVFLFLCNICGWNHKDCSLW